MRGARNVWLALVIVGSLACAATTPATGVVVEGDVVRGNGVVRHFDFEGGFFAIRGDDSVTYDPTSLADEFKRDGLRVRFVARVRRDLSSFHQAGPIVDLLEISRK